MTVGHKPLQEGEVLDVHLQTWCLPAYTDIQDTFISAINLITMRLLLCDTTCEAILYLTKRAFCTLPADNQIGHRHRCCTALSPLLIISMVQVSMSNGAGLPGSGCITSAKKAWVLHNKQMSSLWTQILEMVGLSHTLSTLQPRSSMFLRTSSVQRSCHDSRAALEV